MNWEAGRPTCSVTERLAWRCPAWTCDASSLPVRFGFVHLWEGRRTAQSPVNAASIGSAASLMNGPGCAAKGLASLPAAHGDFQEREGWLHSLLEFHCNVRDRAQDGWTCTHRSPMVAPVRPGSVCCFGCCGLLSVGLSPRGLAGKALDARHRAVGLWRQPAVLFAHSSWKWAQSEG